MTGVFTEPKCLEEQGEGKVILALVLIAARECYAQS